MGSGKQSTKVAWILAIDPGITGGLVKVYIDGRVEAVSMPKDEQGIAEYFSQLDARSCKAIYLERVWGRKGNGARQITTFMQHVGFLKGCIWSRFKGRTKKLLKEVLPAKWQSKLGIPNMSKDKARPIHKRKQEHKNSMRDIAQLMHPDQKVTLLTADALLIAKYAQIEEGWA